MTTLRFHALRHTVLRYCASCVTVGECRKCSDTRPGSPIVQGSRSKVHRTRMPQPRSFAVTWTISRQYFVSMARDMYYVCIPSFVFTKKSCFRTPFITCATKSDSVLQSFSSRSLTFHLRQDESMHLAVSLSAGVVFRSSLNKFPAHEYGNKALSKTKKKTLLARKFCLQVHYTTVERGA